MPSGRAGSNPVLDGFFFTFFSFLLIPLCRPFHEIYICMYVQSLEKSLLHWHKSWCEKNVKIKLKDSEKTSK